MCRRRIAPGIVLALLFVLAPNPTAVAAAREKSDATNTHRSGIIMPLDDFEAEPTGWKFVGGEEFPGAKGSLQRDLSRAHGGKGSYRLDADFRGGGAYVGTWKDLASAGLPDVEQFRLWVRTKNLKRLGVRIVDESGQCHQKSVSLPIGARDGWKEVVLNVRELVGGEHWAGTMMASGMARRKGLASISARMRSMTAQIIARRSGSTTSAPWV